MRMAKTKRATKTKRPRRQAANLTVRSDLVERARVLKLNLSSVLETALVAAIRQREQQAWLDENAEAIDAHNRWIEKHGLFSDDWREF